MLETFISIYNEVIPFQHDEILVRTIDGENTRLSLKGVDDREQQIDNFKKWLTVKPNLS